MVAPTKPKPDVAKAEAAIAKLAAGYPDVKEENPWGHRAFKVRGKTFLFLGADADGVAFSVKLPESGVAALSLGFTEPTHYGLGKSGWVTARFARGRDVPLPLVKEWLDESFFAIAKGKAKPNGRAKPPAQSKSPAKAKSPTKAKSPAKSKAKSPAKARSKRP